ncbi:MAG: hypothetical protein IT212_07440 [Bacteroidia bacterium]|nr:hypothetical protein [Bacteroidia bacterium]
MIKKYIIKWLFKNANFGLYIAYNTLGEGQKLTVYIDTPVVILNNTELQEGSEIIIKKKRDEL